MKIKHLLTGIVILITVVILMSACAKEEFTQQPLIGEKQVEMTFSTPPLAYAPQVEDDKQVIKLDLVVCKEGIYQYTRPAYTSDYAKFRSTLKIDTGVDVYFFANCNTIKENQQLLQEGTPWEEIYPQLIINQTYNKIENKTVLPMWGEIKDVTISDQNVNNFGKIKLLRSVAGANVFFRLQKGKGMSFTPELAYVYYGADRAYAMPGQENLQYKDGVVTGVKEADSPLGMTTTVQVAAKAKGDSIVNALYMLDNDTKQTGQTNRRTRLVVGGYLEDSKELSYYPLDFFKTGTTELLQVTRNHQYNLTITAVNSEGYPDPDQAAESASVNMDYEVVVWDEYNQENIGIDGPNYLSITKKYVTISGKEGSQSAISITGTYTKEEIAFEFSTSHNGTESLTQEGIKNERFKVEMTGEGTSHKMMFTALRDYDKNDLQANRDKIRLKAGRIEFEIQIEQLNNQGWDDGGNKDVEF